MSMYNSVMANSVFYVGEAYFRSLRKYRAGYNYDCPTKCTRKHESIRRARGAKFWTPSALGRGRTIDPRSACRRERFLYWEAKLVTPGTYLLLPLARAPAALRINNIRARGGGQSGVYTFFLFFFLLNAYTVLCIRAKSAAKYFVRLHMASEGRKKVRDNIACGAAASRRIS